MPDVAATFMEGFEQGILADIEARLAVRCGGVPTRLCDADLKCYIERPFVAGWRVPVLFGDNTVRRIDVLLTPWFPSISARTALVDHPGRLTWPHVEGDGVLCLLSNSHDADLDDPVNVIDHLIARSCKLIDDLLHGEIIERDFKEEFLTYWNYDLNDPRRVYSLVSPEGPTRGIFAWHGGSFSVVGETEEQLMAWLKRRFEGISDRQLEIEKACFLWLESPPLPSEYPHSGASLMELATRAGPAGVTMLQRAGNADRSSLTTVIGSEGRAGPGLIALRTVGSKAKPDRRTRERGFREGNVPEEIALGRLLATATIARNKVMRADALWVHGRGRDTRSEQLSAASAVVFGCGSVGSTVATMLLRAGVGTVIISDPDDLEWANVSRHELGGAAVGLKKSIELARRLQRDFPHASVTGYDNTAQSAIHGDVSWLSDADIVISATGSGQADKALNDWHKKCGRLIPVVYGWTEPFGIAGHAVAIGASGACLSSIVNNLGLSTFELTKFDAAFVTEEPACGMHYAPYGAIELGFVNNLVAELAVDCLLGRVVESTHRMWAGRQNLLHESDGTWSKEALQLLSGNAQGGALLSRDLPACTCCSKDTAHPQSLKLPGVRS
ncbi:ThiF family adenylyltransferase [Pseudorhizobium marinum]|uniref:ThiF family adenylyltransferase n=1 Tax=Pseudorhizobium marinum TaxID=1496690 RepID=UPI0009E017D2|nr:ThiF family adenylyltransferase [Pseudorhizobium marinum]